MNTKDFLVADANNIITELFDNWGIQRNNNGYQYINVPIENKEEVLDRYETGIDSPWEEITDADDLTDAEVEAMINEQKKRIENAYDRILALRIEFDQKHNTLNFPIRFWGAKSPDNCIFSIKKYTIDNTRLIKRTHPHHSHQCPI